MSLCSSVRGDRMKKSINLFYILEFVGTHRLDPSRRDESMSRVKANFSYAESSIAPTRKTVNPEDVDLRSRSLLRISLEEPGDHFPAEMNPCHGQPPNSCEA